ncbi:MULTISPECIES: DNA cytosine methyltransferase [Calothrix]|uniref:Cytosine-specific methyltransferase n=2 Tax=Calothrix TaxID=1186 RepID=A0ABR8A661_9CYAN|nr:MULTISPECIES: DNA cytosine methyltransferase [Calothrix]MBD2194910.1 DNA cytosine methyltransferase [Calothrix parietina FACHB-288]MBD2223508.1 DNA cytosine methyltransferase [Calothrix anomala FACHB-343]
MRLRKKNSELSISQRPIAVDLFAGAGGMTLGFEQAGFDVLAAVEIDPIHCAIHEYNFPFWTVLCQSVVDTTGEEIRKRSQIGDREIDVVICGSPCQGFSIIGKRLFDDPRNSLVFHFYRLVLELQPKFFVMENVRGITIGEHKQILQNLITEFQLKGYQVAENYQILNAAHYGVPQARERLFLLGAREDVLLPKYPQRLTQIAKPHTSSKKKSSVLPISPTVWDAIGDIPEVEQYPELLLRDWVEAEYGKPSNYALILRGIQTLDNDYSYPRRFDSRILSSSFRTKHSDATRERFAATVQGEREPISRFHKLHPAGVCNTLRAGTDMYRGSFTSPRPIHPFTPRCITVREAARLHSYPDWFRFHVTKWHGFRQVGNSVPPLLAKSIALEVMNALGKLSCKPEVVQELGNENLLHFKMSEAAKYYL